MKFNQHRILFLVLLIFISFGFSVSKGTQKKVQKELAKTFEVTDFNLVAVNIASDINSQLPTKINGENFFEVWKEEKLLGYAFVDQAPSKTAKFDYLVVFDDQLQVINSKVLVYREEYGGEIGSKRWLKQFLGKTGNDRVSPDKNIDAIAGATISVRSMTKSMDNLLQTIGILQEKSQL